MTRRFVSFASIVVLAAQVGGCSWWHKRKVRKDFETVKDTATRALNAMHDADGKVIEARDAMTAASKAHADTDVLVAKIHDFAVALKGAVPASSQLDDAVDALENRADSTIEATEVAYKVHRAQSSFVIACNHELAFDDIDPCGAAYDDMLVAAYELQLTAKEYEVTLPVVREPEKD